tara:strand:- start:222 stop:407 length:186 start_codon:yes stop_codon:yes gene_type:complete
MKTFKIAVHNPAMVDYNKDILSYDTIVYSGLKKFNSREDAENWLLEYVEIIEMIGVDNEKI